MKRFGLLIVVVLLSGATLAKAATRGEDTENGKSEIKAAVDFWYDDESITGLVQKMEPGDVVAAGYCAGSREGLTQTFGPIETAFKSVTRSIPKNKRLGYTQMCIGLGNLAAKMRPDDVRKMLIILSDPPAAQIHDLQPLPTLRALLDRFLIGLSKGMKLNQPTLLQAYKIFEDQGLKRTTRFNRLYAALFTYDSETALKVIRSVSDNELREIDKYLKDFGAF